jgi:sporulation protein YlmC with PRC-barrel domain
MLGQTILKKKVVSQAGIEVGHVFDLDFEVNGTINCVIVKPSTLNKEVVAHINGDDLLEIPFTEVRAVGEYVVVDFPK